MQMNFRSAFNGFNREDVVHYIEFLNSKHTAELNQLNSELDYLRTRQAEPAAEPAPQTVADEDTLAQQAARIRELFDRCKAQEETIAELTARLEAVSAAAAPVQAERKVSAEDELEAYRRAERTERMARERAEQMYRQANAVLADATSKVDDAAAIISQMADHVSGRLSEFQSAIAGSKQTLQDAVATMSAIRPEDDRE